MLVRSVIGLVAVSPDIGMRMQVASPWLRPSTRRVVKAVWAAITEKKQAAKKAAKIRRILRVAELCC